METRDDEAIESYKKKIKNTLDKILETAKGKRLSSIHIIHYDMPKDELEGSKYSVEYSLDIISKDGKSELKATKIYSQREN